MKPSQGASGLRVAVHSGTIGCPDENLDLWNVLWTKISDPQDGAESALGFIASADLFVERLLPVHLVRDILLCFFDIKNCAQHSFELMLLDAIGAQLLRREHDGRARVVGFVAGEAMR